ncbi:SH3 domain-containing protein [Novosphingobium sp.]|uniref:SH3 domain-containing protein n=1 Tax=Novosphingobium sp. TaxID=1874826 RepID=UPI0025DEFE5B|nr:SH3 domain-containing protein [Novosphingobium sp.]
MSAADPIQFADPSVVGASFSLTGPSPVLAAGHVAVRGDLAHIAMAGKWFVPHYAVPMPHVVRAGGASLLMAASGAEVLENLAAGAQFDVLEVSGGWCWGQAGEGGFVGYVAADKLEVLAS